MPTRPMPAIDTSWGYAPVTGVDDFEGDNGQTEVTLYNTWTVYCLRHDFGWDEEDQLRTEALAQSPDIFCPACLREWIVWIAEHPAPPTDWGADNQRELDAIKRAGEHERNGPEGVEYPEGWQR